MVHQEQTVRSQGVGGTPDGPHVARVLEAVQYQPAAPRQPLRRGKAGQFGQEQHPLGGFGVAQALQKVRRDLYPPGVSGAVSLCPPGGDQGVYNRPRLYRLLQQLGALGREQPRLPPGGPASIQLSDLNSQRILSAGNGFHPIPPLEHDSYIIKVSPRVVKESFLSREGAPSFREGVPPQTPSGQGRSSGPGPPAAPG